MELYLLKSIACMGIFYIVYKLLLERESMHKVKRFYLIGSLIASIGIPLITFVTYIEMPPITTVLSSEINTTPVEFVETSFNYWAIVLWSIYSVSYTHLTLPTTPYV